VDFTRSEHSKNLLHLFKSLKAIDDQGIERHAVAHLTEKPIEHFMAVTHNRHLTTPQPQQKNRFPTGLGTPVEHQNPGLVQTSSPLICAGTSRRQTCLSLSKGRSNRGRMVLMFYFRELGEK
jgi:hypothetical protein